MPLSEYEKAQFELLTADLGLDDSDLKEMTKRERAITMSYVALSRTRWSREIVAVMMLCLGLALFPVSLLLLLLDKNLFFMGEISGIVLFVGAIANLAPRKTGG
jgi:hypothetical protein